MQTVLRVFWETAAVPVPTWHTPFVTVARAAGVRERNRLARVSSHSAPLPDALIGVRWSQIPSPDRGVL